MLVQEFLRKHSLADLERQHAVYASRSKCGRKISLNYDMWVDATESDPLARQCRGLILSRASGYPFDGPESSVGETTIIARPFDRFFNHGQGGADASKYLGEYGTRVFEKLDGTLCIVHCDLWQNRWHVATRAVPEADRPIDGFGKHTFRSLFEFALKDHLNLTFDRLTEHLDDSRTYLFELVSPYNRQVVEYNRSRVYLLGIRDTQTGKEFCPIENPIRGISVPWAPSMECYRLSDVLHIATYKSPREREGVVVRGPNFERVKVKNPAYVALSAMRDGVSKSPRRLLEVILLEKSDDVFPMLPPDTAEYGRDLQRRYVTFARMYDALYSAYRDEVLNADNYRKAFAMAIQRDKRWMAPLMNRFNGRCGDFYDFVRSQRDDRGGWIDTFLDTMLAQLSEISGAT